MGAAHSSEPRSVSMDNPTASGVVDVSDEVVARLKNSIKKQKVKETGTAPAAPQPQPVAAKTERVIPITPPPLPRSSGNKTMYSNANIMPISAMDVYRQKELELQENDTQWRNRMTQLEQTLNKTDDILENEFSSSVENVRKRFSTAQATHKLPPCQDLKAQLMACYRTFPHETLKCSDEVAKFTNCVNSSYCIKVAPNENVAESKDKATAKAA